MNERIKKSLPVLVLALFGLGISIVAQVVHNRLATDENYASFCNVSATVNCDVVMSSGYASLAGIPVSAWAILYYLVMIATAAALMVVERARTRQRVAAATMVLAGWGLLFSIYMAVIAFAVLHTVCVMCSGLYLVSVGMFACVWRLRSQSQIRGRRQAAQRAGQDRWVLIGSAVAVVLLAAAGSWEAFGRSVNSSAPADVARERPDFYRWYLAQPVMQVPLDGGHARGNADAPVTIVEFSDFECGHCANFHRSVDDALHRFGQGIRVVFHHFPLNSECNPRLSAPLHREACLAAVASECAAEQGKFWQYHDLLFSNQQHLERDSLIAYATRLGLASDRFAACLDSPEPRARVQHDISEAADLGIDSTPTVFINGRLVKGALEPELLGAAITLAQAPSTSR